jgi:hypothetical protein
MEAIYFVAVAVVGLIIGLIIGRSSTINSIEREGYKVLYFPKKKEGEGRYMLIDIRDLIKKKVQNG